MVPLSPLPSFDSRHVYPKWTPCLPLFFSASPRLALSDKHKLAGKARLEAQARELEEILDLIAPALLDGSRRVIDSPGVPVSVDGKRYREFSDSSKKLSVAHRVAIKAQVLRRRGPLVVYAVLRGCLLETLRLSEDFVRTHGWAEENIARIDSQMRDLARIRSQVVSFPDCLRVLEAVGADNAKALDRFTAPQSKKTSFRCLRRHGKNLPGAIGSAFHPSCDELHQVLFAAFGGTHPWPGAPVEICCLVRFPLTKLRELPLGVLESLETVLMASRGELYFDPKATAFLGAGRLRTVTFAGRGISHVPMTWAQLTELTIRENSGQICLDILLQCGSLITAEFSELWKSIRIYTDEDSSFSQRFQSSMDRLRRQGLDVDID
ncbi:hypothetical protein C8R47DRAFT_1230572 [Mycena vitilis]|nr:hypothetical protein C8R47DRAFT_1230572 [Mycena vitilis]